MNAKQLEQLLLLEQSGELSPKQRRRLDAELAASAEARQLRDQLRGLAAAIPAARRAARPRCRRAHRRAPATSRQARDRLPARLEARPRRRRRPRPPSRRPHLPGRPPPVPTEPAVASAAAEEEEWTDPLDAEFTELESLLVAISSDDSLEITEL